jgi:hypothetical protein
MAATLEDMCQIVSTNMTMTAPDRADVRQKSAKESHNISFTSQFHQTATTMLLLETAVPYRHNHLATATPHHDDSNKDNQDQSHQALQSRPILYLGFMIGVLLQTVDLCVRTLSEMDWPQQVGYSLLWSFAVTLSAIMVMLCVQHIASIPSENLELFQATFMVGVFSALASRVALTQVPFAAHRLVWCGLSPLVLGITSIRRLRNVTFSNDKSEVNPTEHLMFA